jgi:hypothetical protein
MLGSIVDWCNKKRNAEGMEIAPRTRSGFAWLAFVA